MSANLLCFNSTIYSSLLRSTQSHFHIAIAFTVLFSGIFGILKTGCVLLGAKAYNGFDLFHATRQTTFCLDLPILYLFLMWLLDAWQSPFKDTYLVIVMISGRLLMWHFSHIGCIFHWTAVSTFILRTIVCHFWLFTCGIGSTWYLFSVDR